MTPYIGKEFLDLKTAVESHKRLCGYYIIKLVDIMDLRAAGADDEEIAEQVFQYFDDHLWPALDQRPSDQAWADYEREMPVAKQHTLEALVGASSIGHTKPTMTRRKAERYFEQFEQMFEEPRKYFTGMGFGDPRYVFQYGVAIISHKRAGVLWIVESD
jgi:hypothetical protein